MKVSWVILVFVVALVGGAIGGLATALPPVRQMVLQVADQDTKAASAEEWEEKLDYYRPFGTISSPPPRPNYGSCQVKETKTATFMEMPILWVVLRCPKGR